MSSIPTTSSDSPSTVPTDFLPCRSEGCTGRISEVFVKHMTTIRDRVRELQQAPTDTETAFRNLQNLGQFWLTQIRAAKQRESELGTGGPVRFDEGTMTKIPMMTMILTALRSRVEISLQQYNTLLAGSKTILEHEKELCEHLRKGYEPQSFVHDTQVDTYEPLMSDSTQVFQQLAEETRSGESSVQTQ